MSAVGLTFATNLWAIAADGDVKTGPSTLARMSAWTALAFTALALIYSAIRQGFLEHKVSHLEGEKTEMAKIISGFGSDYFDIWGKRLQVLAEELNFDARDRISVYRFNDDAFTMVGRFSVLPDLNKPGRSVYPADEGVIGAAWRSGDGKCIVTDLPDPTADWDEYLKRNLDQWQMPNEVVQSMNMKPRSVAAYSLMDPQGKARNAIIVFESTAADRFSSATLEKRINGGPGKEIIHLLEILRVREPSLEYARAKGF